MRWFLTGMMATVLALAVSGAAQACGCCGCCQQGGSGKCPSCPQQGAGSCPNCPQHAASYGTDRYWSSAYGCYLYYEPSTRRSYYWSETERRYYPLQDSFPGMAAPAAVPASSTTTTYSTRYFDPGQQAGNSIPR